MVLDDRVKNFEILPCPFCGGAAKLKRCTCGFKRAPGAQILDSWKVICSNGCCESKLFEDNIYHSETGEIVVENNGAYEAILAWNKRK